MNDVLQQILNNISVVLKGYPIQCKRSISLRNRLIVLYDNRVLANIDFCHTKIKHIYNLWIPVDSYIYINTELRNKVIDKLKTYLEMMGFNKL